MRFHARALIAVVLAVGLLALFLREVDVRGVVNEIVRAQPMWLALSFASMFVNLAIRSLRWRYLLEPIGNTSFANSFRATAVGFAARSVLPAAAGEFVRPYFLSRHEPVSATGAFATVIVERLLDTLTVVVLLMSFLFVFGDNRLAAASPVAVAAVKWAAGVAATIAIAAFVVLFVLAGRPAKVKEVLDRLERVVPSTFAGLLSKIAYKFLAGLGAVRRPGRLLIALLWSFPLWWCIGFGVFAITEAFRLAVPFTGSFLIVGLLTIGIAVPTPGAVGGFHEAFRIAVTEFFGAPHDAAVGAAIVAHALSIGPFLLLGVIFAAQAGLNLSGMRQLVNQADAEPGRIAQ